MDKITSVISSGASGLLVNSLSGRSNFTDITNATTATNATNATISTTTLIIVIIIVILFFILFVVATYKLTGSVLQTMLCVFFGAIYILLAYIYYAFSGYKYLKPNRS